jgi:hypothetical protein
MKIYTLCHTATPGSSTLSHRIRKPIVNGRWYVWYVGFAECANDRFWIDLAKPLLGPRVLFVPFVPLRVTHCGAGYIQNQLRQRA